MIRLLVPASLSLLLASACVDSKAPQKGEVDDSTPPESPIADALGKADDASRVIAIDVESAHPYANNMNEEFVIDLEGIAPSCASHVRLHFASLQLESGYDFIHIVDAFGNIVETGTGNHDDEYSDWLPVDEDSQVVSVVLETDYSIVRHGFRIDGFEWQGSPICPAFVPSCDAGEVNINPAPGPCECESLPTCVAIADVEASHSVGGGFAGTFSGTRLHGTTAISFSESVTEPDSETVLGTVDAGAIAAFVYDSARSGVLHGPSVSEPANWSETFAIRAGATDVDYVREAGTYPLIEAQIIAQYDGLLDCGSGGALTCAAGLSCVDRRCTEEASCVCPAIADPQCGVDGHTYGNACEAGCAGVAIAHSGLCGIEGDACGGFLGLACQPDFKCRYGESQWSAPFPDAGGFCVSEFYCDAAADCAGLIHIAVPGAWACNENLCAWEQGSPWLPIEGWSMETSHPYANDSSQWTQLYAPAGAGSVRVEIEGEFSLESGYDFLEVWSWNGTSWFRAARFTGQEAAGAAYEFGGRYHYLHFVSDYSVTDHGFSLAASYSFDEI